MGHLPISLPSFCVPSSSLPLATLVFLQFIKYSKPFLHTIPSSWNTAHHSHNSLLFILCVQLKHHLIRNSPLTILSKESLLLLAINSFFSFILCFLNLKFFLSFFPPKQESFLCYSLNPQCLKCL